MKRLVAFMMCAVSFGASAQSNNCYANPCDLPLQSVALSSDFELWYNIDEAFGGVQLEFETSGELTEVGGGVFETFGFYESFSSMTYLAFSLEGTEVPGGCGALTQFSVTGPNFYIVDTTLLVVGGFQTLAVEVINDGAPLACTAGCTDPAACNYFAAATIDDGSCVAEDLCGECGGDNSSCSGCTHENATNYDSTATIEDGSCLYSQDTFDAAVAEVDITVDNQDQYDAGYEAGAASAECPPCTNSDCPGDFTADGYIGVDDILSMLSLYDTSCAVCGNGIVEGSEQCDDGNDILGDGCDNCMWGGDPQDD